LFLPVVSGIGWINKIPVNFPFSNSSLMAAVSSYLTRRTNLFAFKLSNTTFTVSLPGLIAIRCVGTPLFPKAPKIKMNIMGNNKLNTIEIGCAKMALKLALVIAHRALD
jgi:hypothetical protein